MARRKRRKKNQTLVLIFCLLFVSIMVAAGVTAAMLSGPVTPKPSSSSQQEPLPSDSEPEPETEPGDRIEPEDDNPIQPVGSVIDNTPVSFNKPDEMRAVYLVPGVDFLAGSDKSEAAVKKEIDAAINNAKKLTMNTLVIDTTLKDKVTYKSNRLPKAFEVFDPTQYIIEKARENSFYVYAIFDVLLTHSGVQLTAPDYVDGAFLDSVAAEARSFGETYKVDGILLRSYYNPKTDSSYAAYLKAGGAIGYENYMTKVPDRAVKLVSDTLRTYARGTQVGLLTDPVWANKAENENGSATKASFTALGSGNADVKGYIEQNLVDFIVVDAYGSLTDSSVPFSTVVKWWGKLASDRSVDMYVLQSSSRMASSSEGWSAADQLVKQVIEARTITGYSGSIFNSLSRLVANPGDGTNLLLKYYNNEVKAENILTELTISTPTKNTFTTYDKTVTFRGGADPTQKVTVNGKEIEVDKNGLFAVSYELQPGTNTFVFEHKTKKLTYTITRQVQVLKEVSPVGSLTVNGGTEVTITALAYEGATVTATVNGTTVKLQASKTDDDTAADLRETSYIQYSGVYKAPGATSSVQNIGNIKVSASWQGVNETLTGASIKVNKQVAIGDGKPVEITSEAETFPTSTLNDISDSSYYPLPAGARDYTLGDQIVYKEGNSTFTYYNLASGLRVYASNVKATSKGVENNKINGMSVVADSRYTKLNLFTEQQVSYTFSYSSNQISIEFHNTKSVPGNLSLNKNPLFTSATWSGSTLKLQLRKSGAFLGFKPYYENGVLVFRFNNPPAMSGGGLGGAYIVVDPGHGGSDPGALGSHPSYPEKVINLAIAEKLVDILVDRGASVKMINTNSYVSLQSRVDQAKAYNPNLFVSIHNNASTSTTATGSEAYYFRPFASGLASNIASRAASALSTNNRGGKFGRYFVTRVAQYPAVLTEGGFVTTQSEYEKLMSSSYQEKIATGIANAIQDYFSSVGGGTVITGTQSVGSTNLVSPTSITLNKNTLSLAVGAIEKLVATVLPENASNKTVLWTSSDATVATVSEDGTVKALKTGTTTITAKTEDGGHTATCTLTVTGGAIAVSLNKTALTLQVDAEETLIPTVTLGGTATEAKVTWSVEGNEGGIISLSSDGKIKALKPGTVTVRATSVADTTKSAFCTVTVTAKNVAVTGVSLNKTSLTLTVGGSETLTATFQPSDASNKNVTWSSDKSNIATVDEHGKVTAKAKGTAVVTVKTAEGNFTATCTVTVNEAPVAVTGVTLNKSSLTLKVGGSETLIATVQPTGATNKAVTWQSSDTNVVTVADGKVTADKAGTAVITVKTEEGDFTATCTVTVDEEEVAVTGVSLDVTSLTLTVGAKSTLKASVIPSNATNKKVTWSCTGSGITVDSSGTVQATEAGGPFTVTVTTEDGGFIAQCEITVPTPESPE